MRIDIFKNFITPEQCQELNAWVYQGIENGWLDRGVTKTSRDYELRLTTRLYAHRFEYPDTVRTLSSKIRQHVGIADYPLIEGHGRDGVVVSYIKPGGDLWSHQDPRSKEGLFALRCNIMTQAPDIGGVLVLDGQEVDVNVGDLHCYLASKYLHHVTEVKGDTPRIMWMFGSYVPEDVWENNDFLCQ
jgi:hypothetical protein